MEYKYRAHDRDGHATPVSRISDMPGMELASSKNKSGRISLRRSPHLHDAKRKFSLVRPDMWRFVITLMVLPWIFLNPPNSCADDVKAERIVQEILSQFQSQCADQPPDNPFYGSMMSLRERKFLILHYAKKISKLTIEYRPRITGTKFIGNDGNDYIYELNANANDSDRIIGHMFIRSPVESSRETRTEEYILRRNSETSSLVIGFSRFIVHSRPGKNKNATPEEKKRGTQKRRKNKV